VKVKSKLLFVVVVLVLMGASWAISQEQIPPVPRQQLQEEPIPNTQPVPQPFQPQNPILVQPPLVGQPPVVGQAPFSNVPFSPGQPPVLGQPIPTPNSGSLNPLFPNDAGRSALDPINLDSLPPTLFPQNPIIPTMVDNLTRDKSIYGSVRDEPAIFINVDFGAVIPNLKNQLNSTVTYQNGRVVNVDVASANLDWAFQPHLELGYRLPGEEGGFAISWRGYASSGTSSVPINLLPANVKTEVSFNIGDLDYIAPMFQPFKEVDVFYRIGARIGAIYFSSSQKNEIHNLLETNYMFGGGPHLCLESHKRFKMLSGFSHFASVDGTVLIGQTNQNFTSAQKSPEGELSGTTNQFKIQSIPAVTFQTGFSYTPSRAPNTKYSVGYQIEQYWNIGNVNNSKGQLGDNAFFFRTQVDF